MKVKEVIKMGIAYILFRQSGEFKITKKILTFLDIPKEYIEWLNIRGLLGLSAREIRYYLRNSNNYQTREVDFIYFINDFKDILPKYMW